MKRSFLKYLILIVYSSHSWTNQSFAQINITNKSYLYPIEINDNWGFIDSTGKIIVQPQFKYVNDFVNGLGQVDMEADTIGFFNINGRLIKKSLNPDPNRKYLHYLSEGLLAIFDSSTKKFGFINELGDWIIKPKFKLVNDFSDGLAAVWQNEDEQENTNYADSITEGNPCVKCGFGFINMTGNFIIEPIFNKVSNFYNGFAYADGKIIDKTGKEVKLELVKDKEFLIHRFNFIDTLMYKSPDIWIPNNEENFLNGFIMFENKAFGKYGFKDWDGNVVINPSFNGAQFFSENVAAVKSQENKWGYINLKGDLIIKPKFDFALPFCEGLAPVTYKGKWGFIDKTGDFTIPPILDEVDDFNLMTRFWGGFARMVRDKKMCYINKQGKIIWVAP